MLLLSMLCLKNILNVNDKSEPVPHLEDSVRIIISWFEYNYRTSKNQLYQRFAGRQQEGLFMCFTNCPLSPLVALSGS